MHRHVVLFADGGEGIHEAREKSGREFRVQRKTQTRSADGNTGRTDGPHSKSRFVEQRGKSDRAFIIAEKDRNDLCIASADIKTSFAQFVSQERDQYC